MPAFSNFATLSYNNVVTNSNVVTGEIMPTVTVTKNVIGESYSVGDTLTYVVSILNNGNNSLTGVTVTDNLGGYVFNGNTLYPLTYVEGSLRLYIDGALAEEPTVAAGPPLVVSGITVPSGGNALLIYEAEVNSFAPVGEDGAITNTVTVTGTGIAVPITASATTRAESELSLTISKSVCPDSLFDGEELTYTFVIQNSGNVAATAEDNVTVTDIFVPILSDIEVTLDGVAWTSPANYTYNEATGEFVTVPGQITVPAASYEQDDEGRWVITPGVAVLRVTGTV